MARKPQRTLARESMDGRVLIIRLEEDGKRVTIWEQGRKHKYVATFADLARLALAGVAVLEEVQPQEHRRRKTPGR